MLSLVNILSSTGALASGPSIPPAEAAPELSWAGLILWLPLLSACLCGLCAIFKVRNKLPAIITSVCLATSFLLVVMLYGRHEQTALVHLFDWINLAWAGEPGQSFIANFTLYIDSLSLLWMLFVTGLGTLITIYASEYMEPDLGTGYCRFFAGISIFLFAMSALVLGDNLVLLYLGWEGVGFASYMLIGYYYQRASAVAAAKKAFIMNRIGDLGLAAAIWLIWTNLGSVSYDTLFAIIQQDPQASSVGGWSTSLIPWLLMIAAFGKSAQFPLYVWLPDAMEGPTPVSALIHAATMVTAGIYLIARMYPFFMMEPASLQAVAWVGGFTALLAATIGMAQYDIKRVMAYSTVSQLGYMFMGLGVITSFGAVYHVFTHAFFKAVLFLTCGAIMHGFAGQLDLRKLSGLIHIKGWRITSITMLIGCLWLAGFPLTAGYFSKDTILAQSFITPGPGFVILGWIAVLTAGLTAYYTFRVWFRVCLGPVHYEPGDEHHGDDDHHGDGSFHPHAPRLAINAVLVIIAAGAIVSGLDYFYADEVWVKEMVGDSSAMHGIVDSHGDHEEHHSLLGMDPHLAMYFISGGVGIIGLVIAWWLHLYRRQSADALRARLLDNPATRWLPIAMENKWYVDEIYNAAIRLPLWILGHALSLIDKLFVDGLLVDGIARIPRALGRVFQPLANGVLQGYAVTMVGGAVLILAWVVWFWLKGGF